MPKHDYGSIVAVSYHFTDHNKYKVEMMPAWLVAARINKVNQVQTGIAEALFSRGRATSHGLSNRRSVASDVRDFLDSKS
jgi:hypothetical protein